MLEWLFPVFSTCIFCGVEDISSLDCGLCKDCYEKAPFAHDGNTIFYYEGDVAKQVQNLKYNNKRYLAKIFARLGKDRLDRIDYDVICFVPTRHEKERGYNQAELIARAINSDRTVKALVKIKDTVSQTELSAEERAINIKDCFRVIDKSAVFNKRILLIDDVYTTGSTIKECGKMLMQAGAKEIYLFTICKTR